jgi:hypothetical protein
MRMKWLVGGRVDAVVAALKTGASASQIAAPLGVSRSAVLSVILRQRRRLNAEVIEACRIRDERFGAGHGRRPGRQKVAHVETISLAGSSKTTPFKPVGRAAVGGRRTFGRSFTLPVRATGLPLFDWFPTPVVDHTGEPPSKRVEFLATRTAECRWIDDGGSCCGAPTMGRSSYCQYHHGVVYVRRAA